MIYLLCQFYYELDKVKCLDFGNQSVVLSYGEFGDMYEYNEKPFGIKCMNMSFKLISEYNQTYRKHTSVLVLTSIWVVIYSNIINGDVLF